MVKFKPTSIALALLASGTMAVSFPAMAAEAETQDEQKEQKVVKDKQTGVTVTVTGFRESLQKSAAMKKNNSAIVETLSAEDIGKLPDVSIAESLARLPGLAAQRLDGRANVISIRGLGPELNMTTLNGREQVTIGDSRAVEFDQYPSEMINEVVVYKTPNAALATTQGLGGTTDLRTIKPLALGEKKIKATARLEQNSLGNLNPDTDDTGERFSLTFVDQFADDTVGIALGLSHMNSPNQEERWNAWGYPTLGLTTDGNGNDIPYQDRDGNDIDPDTLVIGGAKPYVRSSELKRTGFMGVVEYVPNANYAMTFDAFYSDFEDRQTLRGIEIPLAWGGGWSNNGITPLEVNDGYVTELQVNNGFFQVRNDMNIRDAELQAYGLNNVFTIDQNWEVEADLSYSKADRADWGLESYAGTGRGNFNGIGDNAIVSMNGTRGITVDPTINYADPNVLLLGGNLSWGNGLTVPSDGQDGFINNPWVQDELTALKFSANRALSNDYFTNLEFGVNLSERDKFKRDKGSFLTLNAYPQMLAVPSEFLLPATSLGFLGIDGMLSYDMLGLYNSGVYNETSENLTVASRATNSWDVSEEITTAYFKLDVDAMLGGTNVRGDLGLQIVHADQSSTGNAVRPEEDSNGDPTGFQEVYVASGGADYTEVLPSINLAFEVADDQLIRVGLARTLQRPRMDQLNASRGFNFNAANANTTQAEYEQDPTRSPWSGSGGNPQLRPWLMDQIDVSYENYFDEGYFSAAIYHKHLENWINDNSTVEADFSATADSLGIDGVITQGLISAPENGSGGYVRGGELTLNLPFAMISESLDGFGTVLSFSYADSEVREDSESDPIRLQGLSRKVANGTVYYENGGFQFRTSVRYRSDFLGEVTGLSLARTTVTVQAETLVDAQVSYDFEQSGVEGLSVFLQATNLTDEPFISYSNDDRRQVRDHQVYGRNMMLGVSYEF
ncbi:TonB-dependent receptor [Pleionea mediterranea]|uniref:Iron complex outermembrane receptor protein n=1 Tax=Pleionea mediterranea TaxID=523701 RepID=A0A316G389_9GAMM|nr:TonB-dependent receptor [Pleionea mediterranea]PWK54376.1 iron complex outermembrane receptor protein [Pleionea mediterranea]